MRGRDMALAALTSIAWGLAFVATRLALDGFSAHADRVEILRWLSGFARAPGRTYIVHGEPHPAQSLAERIRTQLRWEVHVAADGEMVAL